MTKRRSLFLYLINTYVQEYPDIPSIPEEFEEDDCSTPSRYQRTTHGLQVYLQISLNVFSSLFISRSPVIFSEFDPDTLGGVHGSERREGSGGPDQLTILPWQGILRKTARANQ